MATSPKFDSENSRLAAARIVSSWLKSQTFPDREFDALETSRAFVMEMVLGIVRWYGALSWIRDRLAPQKPRPEVDACILVGLYQLLFMDDVQEYAAVHETVEAARSAGGEKVAGFVNAVLRRAQAEKKEIIRNPGKTADDGSPVAPQTVDRSLDEAIRRRRGDPPLRVEQPARRRCAPVEQNTCRFPRNCGRASSFCAGPVSNSSTRRQRDGSAGFRQRLVLCPRPLHLRRACASESPARRNRARCLRRARRQNNADRGVDAGDGELSSRWTPRPIA